MNCLNVINNGSAYSVMFLSTSRSFLALRKTLENSIASHASKIFLRAGNNPVVLKNSAAHAEPLLIASIDNTLTPFHFSCELLPAYHITRTSKQGPCAFNLPEYLSVALQMIITLR